MTDGGDAAFRPIGLLITELAFGGTPRSVQRLAEGLWRDGYDVRVATLMSKLDIAFELEGLGIPVTTFDIDTRGATAAARGLYRFLRRERIGVLHTFNFHANLLGRIVGRAAGVPVILGSERSVESAKANLRVWCDRLTWRLASRWTTNAKAAARVMTAREWIDASRIDIIPSGVDVDAFAPRARDDGFRARYGVAATDSLILCVGRLDRYKGHACLLEAFGILARERPGQRLALVGDGRYRGDLEQACVTAGLADRVVFTGAMSDVRPALSAADLFVLASEEEGMPSSVLEAMAMGVPVVATDVGGTPEIVVHGETGLLVPPKQPDMLAGAMRRVLDDPALHAAFSRAGRARVVASFSLEQTVRLSEQLYVSLMSTGGLRADRARPSVKTS